jgi:catecholate siderophore receptor
MANRNIGVRSGLVFAATFLVSAAAPDSQVLAQAAQRPSEVMPGESLPAIEVHGNSGDIVRYLAKRTSTATKTDTPLIDTPQSVTIVTKEQIKDQSFQSVGEALRYVPGVIPHQGEGNRDDVVIRGQRSNADFFVNGIRDDVQYFRDLYNVQQIEVLKGPNAMIFGRGGGGGVINRVLKGADGVPVREVTFQGGQFNDRRFAVDLGGKLTDTFAARLNAVYEDTDTYRRFVDIHRYGINPVIAFRPSDSTKVELSYEHFHDDRTADRGIPSQFGRPYNYRANTSTFFGNPDLNQARVDANIATATVEHETDAGLKMKSQLRYADYDKFYQNIFPGGAVNAAGTSVNLSAYNNTTNRENLFSQNDFTYKFDTGFMKHTLLAGFELGQQMGLSYRQSGFFNNTSSSLAVSPLSPVTLAPVTFRNIASDANSTYRLGLAATYLQDQIELNQYLQFIAGVRYDRFDLSSRDRRTGATLERVDDLISPRFGVVVKPVQDVSVYGSYSVSYLPSAGDQFSSLSPGLVIAEPERFENREVGVKWDVTPALQLSAAVYDLDRTNQRLPDPNRAGFFLLSGATNARGFELAANGAITERWRVAGGYAYTDARIVSNTSATIVAGNTVGLVPLNTFTLWNKYDLTPNLGVGVGIINQTHSFASSDNTVRLPGFTRVDAGVFYKFTDYIRAQVNIENVFDRKYIATADGNNNISPGAPRTVRFQLTASF